MIQCFVKKEYEAPFGLTQMPRLFSVSRNTRRFRLPCSASS